MPHVTSIGLDVHARSVAAAAFNPFTGEVVHRDFGTDAAEIAEWALGFEEPRACYESGPTGFHMARELRALGLDCAVAAVSKMQRPAADARRKNDRRDAEFIARMLATHNSRGGPAARCGRRGARDRPMRPSRPPGTSTAPSRTPRWSTAAPGSASTCS